jgi:hypothetical protein
LLNQIHPLDLTGAGPDIDESGTPAALIELARRRNTLAVVDSLDDGNVLVEFPMGRIWERQTGCHRFVLLRRPLTGGKRYAMVRSPRPDVETGC